MTTAALCHVPRIWVQNGPLICHQGPTCGFELSVCLNQSLWLTPDHHLWTSPVPLWISWWLDVLGMSAPLSNLACKPVLLQLMGFKNWHKNRPFQPRDPAFFNCIFLLFSTILPRQPPLDFLLTFGSLSDLACKFVSANLWGPKTGPKTGIFNPKTQQLPWFLPCVRTQEVFHLSLTFVLYVNRYNWDLWVLVCYPCVNTLSFHAKTRPQVGSRFSFQISSNLVIFATCLLYYMAYEAMDRCWTIFFTF